PDPNLAAALDRARHGDTRGFNLPVGDPPAGQRFQAELSEGDIGAAPGLSTHAPALLLPVLDLLWHQHKKSALLGVPLAYDWAVMALGLTLHFVLPGRSRWRERRGDRSSRFGRLRQLTRRRLHGRTG